MGKNKNFRKNFFAGREGRNRPAANDRLTAVKAQAVACFCEFGFRLAAGVACRQWRKPSGLLLWVRFPPDGGGCLSAIVPRAPPCTRKGHCPLTQVGASCGLLLWVRFPPCGGDCLSAIVLRAPPCTRKGHRPLTQVGASCGLLLWGFGFRLAAGLIAAGRKNPGADV